MRAALLLTGLLLAAAVGWRVSIAWQATALREAYLPDLEGRARHSPYDGPLQALLGGRLLEAAEYAAARDALKAAAAAGEAGPEVWQTLAAATAAAGDPPKALADLQVGLRNYPGAQGLSSAADRLRTVPLGSPAAGVAAAICPEGPRELIAARTGGSFLNGPVEWWGRAHPESTGFTTRLRWAQSRPNDAEAQRLWGLALLRNRRYPEAEAALTRAVGLDPGSPAVHLALGDLERQRGQSTRAAREYLACLKLRPRWLPALLRFGQAALDLQLQQPAIDAYLQATQIAPRSAEAWIGRGRAYTNTHIRWGDAAAAFDRAAQLAPKRVDFLAVYADALRQASREKEAERVARRYIQAAPGDSYGHYLLSRILMNADPSPEGEKTAEAEAREALRLAPHNPNASARLAEILLRRGSGEEALPLLSDARRQDRYNVSTARLLVRALARAGKEGESRKLSAETEALFAAQQRASVLEDQETHQMSNLKLHEELARLYERTGQRARAQRERDLSLLLQRDPKGAAAALQQYRADLKDVFQEP